MKLFVIVVNVEGVLNQIEARHVLSDAIDCAVELAAEQCDSSKDAISKTLKADCSFTSANGDIVVAVQDCVLPKPKRRGKTDPNRLTVRVPVEVAFSTDPAELDDREGEKRPTKRSLVKYLKDALTLGVDNEGEGQPEGAVFAAAGVDWGKAELVKG
jgi:hypothetical protein